MTGGTQRYRKPEKVIEELDEIVQLHKGARLRIHIADPNFGGKRRITEELYDRMIEWRQRCDADVHFFVSLRPSAIASSRALTTKMIAAGIDYLFVGMESPNNEELKRVKKGGETRERQELAARYLRAGGAEIMSNFLIGLPGQTPEDILGLVDYAKGLELADCYFSVVTPLPGSQLYTEAVEQGLLLETDVTRYRLYDTVMQHDTMTRAKVREMCVRANAKWYDDLMLPAERRRALANGHKRKLYDFAGKFTVLANFFSLLGSGANTEFAELDPAMLVQDMPTPALRAFTERHRMHEFIEMRRFLRILGEQHIQVTLQSQSRDVVSWVARTTPRSVEYLDAVHGVPSERPTVLINIVMDPGALTGRKILRRLLEDNPNLRARVNLLRLAAAAGSEVARAYIDGAAEKVRSGVTALINAGVTGLRGFAWRLTGRGRASVLPAPPTVPVPAMTTEGTSTVVPIAAFSRRVRLEQKAPEVRATIEADAISRP